MLVDPTCILKLLKLETTSSQKNSCQTHKLVCLTASFLATGGFLKLFHKIPWFFHIYSDFFKFHDFSMLGTFWLIFQVFHGFQSLWEPCWSESSLGEHSLPWFCPVMAHMKKSLDYCQQCTRIQLWISTYLWVVWLPACRYIPETHSGRGNQHL